MAQDKGRKDRESGGGQDSSIPYDPQQLSPRKSDQQEYPAEVRPSTPIEEAGERKGSTEGLADRDVD